MTEMKARVGRVLRAAVRGVSDRAPVVLGIVAMGVACAAPASRAPDSVPAESARTGAPPVRGPGPTGDQAWDRAVIDQLERDARRLANAEGCRDAGSCRVAPYGVKACGGPRGYLVYCVVGTDSVALARKLDELARLERAYNQRYGIASTCDIQVEPNLALVGQTCRAAAP